MLISIAIPTRERAETLLHCLRTCVAIEDGDVEIVVSDNASADNTRAVVESFNDPRIRYVNTGRRVSQRMNFENAATQARGDYICMIGDDDGMLPAQFPVLRAIVAREKPDNLSWPYIFYQWPDANKADGGGRVKLLRKNVYGPALRRSAGEAQAWFQNAEATKFDLAPKIYHGLSSRRVLDRLREKSGVIFGSAQVDIYYSAAASAVIEKHLYIRHPLSVMAFGPRSGARSVEMQHSEVASANNTMNVSLQEGEEDPVKEPLFMRLPTMGLVALAGIEQARRLVYPPDAAFDAAAYYRGIIVELDRTPRSERERGLAMLDDLANELPDGEPLKQLVRAARARPPAFSPAANAKVARRHGGSYVTGWKVALDLKRSGPAHVADAVAQIDRLIGAPPAALVETGRAGSIAWLRLLARAAKAIVRPGATRAVAWRQPDAENA